MFKIFAFMLFTLLPFLVFSETSAHFYHNYDDISVTLETSPGLKTLKHHRMRHGHGHREDGMEITRRYARLTFFAARKFQKVRLFCITKTFFVDAQKRSSFFEVSTTNFAFYQTNCDNRNKHVLACQTVRRS